ncbi:MAG: hypothetical protein JO316_24260 [Abitibacteriaceae bacterium]|nr:hypothetical protein [Abditibacteriaceae bacterium]MBV9868481.1 hypothetical protein [Abditibacteriaceae bacterium]
MCADCQPNVREAARHVDALQQICADRPDLVHYLEGLLREVTEKPPHGHLAPSPYSEENTFLSNYHIRWRAFIGKSRPHIERCKDWQLSEKAVSRSGDAQPAEPQANWTDSDLYIHVNAVECGILTVDAKWYYGPPQGGHEYNCRLTVSGWDLIINVNWLKRTLYTMFYHEPEITLVRADGEISGLRDSVGDDHLDHAENIGGLG